MVINNAEIESVAKVLIINYRNECLVLSLGKHLKYPEKSFLPDLPGGIVDPGESEQEAVVREVYEECGITLDLSNIILAYSETAYYESENKSVTKLLYIAYVNETPKIVLSWEHSDYRWVALSEISDINLTPFFNTALKYSIKNNLINCQ